MWKFLSIYVKDKMNSFHLYRIKNANSGDRCSFSHMGTLFQVKFNLESRVCTGSKRKKISHMKKKNKIFGRRNRNECNMLILTNSLLERELCIVMCSLYDWGLRRCFENWMLDKSVMNDVGYRVNGHLDVVKELSWRKNRSCN